MFKNYADVITGDNNLESSPYGTISVACSTAAGTVGTIQAGIFYPHPDGLLAAGEMLTFEIGRGRVIGFNATTAGSISVMEV